VKAGGNVKIMRTKQGLRKRVKRGRGKQDEEEGER
jgi:hypothetical protein